MRMVEHIRDLVTAKRPKATPDIFTAPTLGIVAVEGEEATPGRRRRREEEGVHAVTGP